MRTRKQGVIFRWLAGAVIGSFFMAGCASDAPPKKDPFFEKWKTLAETSAGSSPVAKPRAIEIKEMLLKSGDDTHEDKTITAVKLLPTNEINLKMRQADVKSVLRSLALAVDLNILIKNEIKGEINVDFKSVPWDQAFNSILKSYSLAYIWEGDSIFRVMSAEDIERDIKQKTQEKEQILKQKTHEMEVKWVEPLLTVVVPIDYAIEAEAQYTTGITATVGTAGAATSQQEKTASRGKVLTENLESLLTRNKEGKPRGSVRVDLHSNSMIITAIKEDLLKILSIIEKIDKPMPQIQIRANIVEASKETARTLGIQWGGVFGRYVGNQSLYITPGGTSGSSVPPGSALDGSYTPAYGNTGVGGQGFGVNFPASGLSDTASGTLGLLFGTIGGNLLEIQLSALQEDGKINILSSPSITTLDNQTAYTQNGEKVPYVTYTNDQTGLITPKVEFVDVVLSLEITPHVIDDKNLKMKVVVKKDEINENRTVMGNPGIWKKETSTNLIVQDGETIVISGLTRLRTVDSESGLPWLKSIPGLGWLFKSSGKGESMEEVLIFITPKILPPRTASAIAGPLTGKPIEKEPTPLNK